MIKILALFFIYSFLGYILEITCKLREFKRFVNRGFLIGPYCPIYGCGVVILYFLVEPFKNYPFLVFFMTIIAFSILEYSVSFILEKLFDIRWWDYSKRKYNLNGRICPGTMIPFGIFGMLIIYVTNPFFSSLIALIPKKILNIILYLISTLFIIDNFVTITTLFKLRKNFKKSNQDDTEEIKNQIKNYLKQH